MSNCLPLQPCPQLELPREYIFKDPYIRIHELVEGKKISSSILTSEDILISYGLGTSATDLVDQVIDLFDSSAAQPCRFLICSKIFLKLLIF